MSTRRWYFCLMLSTMILPAQANEAAAVAAYRRGDLATARTEWLAVLDQDTAAPTGSERARILYDLGNVAFREGQTLEAVGWYTAALRLSPRDDDTWANLEEARSRSKLEPADRGDLSSTTKRLLRSFTPTEARWTALIGILLLAAALAFEALRGGRLARWTAVLAAAVALGMCLPWMDQALVDRAADMIVIRADGAALRSEPRDKAAVTAELRAADIVAHVDDLPDWTKVRLASGLEGWVEKRAVFALTR